MFVWRGLFSCDSLRSRKTQSRKSLAFVVERVCDKFIRGDSLVECVPLWCNLTTTSTSTRRSIHHSQQSRTIQSKCAALLIRDQEAHFGLHKRVQKSEQITRECREIVYVYRFELTKKRTNPLTKRSISKSFLFPIFLFSIFRFQIDRCHSNRRENIKKKLLDDKPTQRCDHPDARSESDCAPTIQHFLQIGLTAAVVKPFVSWPNTQETEFERANGRMANKKKYIKRQKPKSEDAMKFRFCFAWRNSFASKRAKEKTQ